MNNDHPHIALPLEQFFAQLQAAGFKMDTARKLRLLGILEQKSRAHIGNFQELKYRLAPFVATTEAEQQRFYDFFDAFWRECEAEMHEWVENAPTPPPPILKPPVHPVLRWLKKYGGGIAGANLVVPRAVLVKMVRSGGTALPRLLFRRAPAPPRAGGSAEAY